MATRTFLDEQVSYSSKQNVVSLLSKTGFQQKTQLEMLLFKKAVSGDYYLLT
jgi:hypothetical protein